MIPTKATPAIRRRADKSLAYVNGVDGSCLSSWGSRPNFFFQILRFLHSLHWSPPTRTFHFSITTSGQSILYSVHFGLSPPSIHPLSFPPWSCCSQNPARTNADTLELSQRTRVRAKPTTQLWLYSFCQFPTTQSQQVCVRFYWRREDTVILQVTMNTMLACWGKLGP